MIITIDTEKTNNEELKKIIKFLQTLIEYEPMKSPEYGNYLNLAKQQSNQTQNNHQQVNPDYRPSKFF